MLNLNKKQATHIAKILRQPKVALALAQIVAKAIKALHKERRRKIYIGK